MTAGNAELVALAERVEQSTRADRELDAAIWLAVDPGEHDRQCSFKGMKYAGHVHTKEEKVRRVLWASAIHAPAYTASLDAAMTLVPPGAGFNLDRYWIREGVRWKVEIGTGGVPEQPRQVFDCWDAYTAPLAICAAALRSRALAPLSHGERGGEG